MCKLDLLEVYFLHEAYQFKAPFHCPASHKLRNFASVIRPLGKTQIKTKRVVDCHRQRHQIQISNAWTLIKKPWSVLGDAAQTELIRIDFSL